MMKRILISAVLALALAGTSAFAAQNKNAKKPAAKPAAAAPSNAGTMKAAPKRHKKRHKKSSGGTMTTTKKGNANKK
jgi:Ni/Co efflux regulator RcnB